MSNIFLGNPPENIKQWIIADYNRKQEEKLKIPLCFEAVDLGATIALKCNGNNLKTATFETSTDGQNWSDYTYATNITLTNVGDKVYFKAKADNTSIARTLADYLQFTSTQDAKKVNVSGNVMSLLAQEFSQMRSVSSFCFSRLFYYCNNISDCGSLTLPATTLAKSCYSQMFSSCSNLTQAPALPATTLAEYCYTSMFELCTSLTQAPIISTYTSGLNAYESMLDMYGWDTNSWQGNLAVCVWNDLTLSESESMVLNESVFGYENPGDSVRISITCKDGSGTAYYDSEKSSWVFEY